MVTLESRGPLVPTGLLWKHHSHPNIHFKHRCYEPHFKHRCFQLLSHAPPYYPIPRGKSILGVKNEVLLWADMNAATPLVARGCSVMSLGRGKACPHYAPPRPHAPNAPATQLNTKLTFFLLCLACACHRSPRPPVESSLVWPLRKEQSDPATPAASQHSCQPTVKLHILPLVWNFPLGKG